MIFVQLLEHNLRWYKYQVYLKESLYPNHFRGFIVLVGTLRYSGRGGRQLEVKCSIFGTN